MPKTFQIAAANPPNNIYPTVNVNGLIRPAPVSGRFYALVYANQANTAIAAIDNWYIFPFLMPFDFNVNGAQSHVYTGGAGSSVKSAIWANSNISNRPVGPPLFADNTGQATTGSNTTITIPFTPGLLPAGFYWGGMKTTGTPPAVSSIQSNSILRFMMGVSSATGDLASGLQFSDAYANACPTFAEGASFIENNSVSPIFDLKAL